LSTLPSKPRNLVQILLSEDRLRLGEPSKYLGFAGKQPTGIAAGILIRALPAGSIQEVVEVESQGSVWIDPFGLEEMTP
jgi:hypothetical protein